MFLILIKNLKKIIMFSQKYKIKILTSNSLNNSFSYYLKKSNFKNEKIYK